MYMDLDLVTGISWNTPGHRDVANPLLPGSLEMFHGTKLSLLFNDGDMLKSLVLSVIELPLPRLHQ
jgi:hypothetical protein